MDQILSGLQGVQHYLDLQLTCGTLPYVLGAVLSHVMPSGEDRPIALALRSLSKEKGNYAQIEKEALSIIFGLVNEFQH